MPRTSHQQSLRECQAFLVDNMAALTSRDVLDHVAPFLTEDDVEKITVAPGPRQQTRILIQVGPRNVVAT